MAAEAQLEVVRQGYEAFNRRDVDAILALLDDRIVYRMPMDLMGHYPVFRGRDGVREFYRSVFDAFERFTAEDLQVKWLGDLVCVTGTIHARPHGGDETRIRFSHFWTIRDGKAVRVAFHDTDNPFAILDRQARSARSAGASADG